MSDDTPFSFARELQRVALDPRRPIEQACTLVEREHWPGSSGAAASAASAQ
jgi:hypothetical protein